MTRTAERLAVVNMALVNEDEAVPREMIEHFAGCGQCYLVNILVLILCRILIDNVLELSKMSKNFHVRSPSISQPTNILMLCSSHQEKYLCSQVNLGNCEFDKATLDP